MSFSRAYVYRNQEHQRMRRTWPDGLGEKNRGSDASSSVGEL